MIDSKKQIFIQLYFKLQVVNIPSSMCDLHYIDRLVLYFL
jgi:hypothetical protein